MNIYLPKESTKKPKPLSFGSHTITQVKVLLLHCKQWVVFNKNEPYTVSFCLFSFFSNKILWKKWYSSLGFKLGPSNLKPFDSLRVKCNDVFLKNGPFPVSVSLFLSFLQIIGNIGSIKVANNGIRTTDLWCRKRPLCQLSHNRWYDVFNQILALSFRLCRQCKSLQLALLSITV